jgi:hypothetical protein
MLPSSCNGPNASKGNNQNPKADFTMGPGPSPPHVQSPYNGFVHRSYSSSKKLLAPARSRTLWEICANR